MAQESREDRTHSMQMEMTTLRQEADRYSKQVSQLKTTTDRQKKKLADAEQKSADAENELATLRKELNKEDQQRRSQTTEHTNMNVRLNRALEDAQKYKDVLAKHKQDAKESADQAKKQLSKALAANRTLERQKTELMGAFQKQLKLIDILRRQKAHVEAAKVLQFSEQEFLKALEPVS